MLGKRTNFWTTLAIGLAVVLSGADASVAQSSNLLRQQQMQQQQQRLRQQQQQQAEAARRAQAATEAARRAQAAAEAGRRAQQVRPALPRQAPANSNVRPPATNTPPPAAAPRAPTASAPTTAIRGSPARNVGPNERRGFVSSGGTATLTRALTPGEIRAGYTGRRTGDGRMLVRFQGRVFAVPAAGTSRLVRPPANQNVRPAGRLPQVRQEFSVRAQALARPASGGRGRPPGTNLPANNNRESRQAYADFFKTSGRRYRDVFDYRGGVDFTKPAQVRRLSAGTQVCQYGVPGSRTGGHFAPCGQTPSSLGTSATGGIVDNEIQKVERRYTLSVDTDVFESTAAGIDDIWSVEGRRVPTQGGGVQYTIRLQDVDNFSIIE